MASSVLTLSQREFAYTKAEIGTMALAVFFYRSTLPAGTCMLAQVQNRKLNLAKHKKEWQCHIVLEFYRAFTVRQECTQCTVLVRKIEKVDVGTGSKKTSPALCTTWSQKSSTTSLSPARSLNKFGGTSLQR